MYVDKGKKFFFSLHLFVFRCLNPICICYLFEFKYFNYVYKKKKIQNYFFQKKKNHLCTYTRKKKFSPLIFIQMFDSYLYLLSI